MFKAYREQRYLNLMTTVRTCKNDKKVKHAIKKLEKLGHAFWVHNITPWRLSELKQKGII